MENFKNYLRKKKVLIVCNDAGGANFIKSFLKYEKIRCKYYLTGSAVKIFKKKNFYKSLIKSVKKSEIIITGTDWPLKISKKLTNLQLRALNYSNIYKKKSITFIDHWWSYKSRFIKNNKLILPSEIWSFDKESTLKAKKEFKNLTKIRAVNNYYFLDFKKNKKKKLKKKKFHIIYVSSNFNGTNKNSENDLDKRLLLNFIKKKEKINVIKNYSIDILTHPSESFKKYMYFSNKKIYKIRIINRGNLKIQTILNKYAHIVGSESMSLVIGKILGLTVFNNVKGLKIKRLIPKKYIDYYI